MSETLDEAVLRQALMELPQISDVDQRHAAVEDYVNGMTNVELLKLVSRALKVQR